MSSFVGDCIDDVVCKEFDLLRHKHITLILKENCIDVVNNEIKELMTTSYLSQLGVTERKVYDLFIDRLDDIWDYSTYGLIDSIRECIKELYVLSVLDESNVLDYDYVYAEILDNYIIEFQ